MLPSAIAVRRIRGLPHLPNRYHREKKHLSAGNTSAPLTSANTTRNAQPIARSSAMAPVSPPTKRSRSTAAIFGWFDERDYFEFDLEKKE